MKRVVGIDLLRNVSMMFVVMMHVLNAGGILDTADRNTYYAKIAYAMFIIAFCGVDCFALISGFVGWKLDVKPSRIIMLWLQTLFYSVIISIIFVINNPELSTMGLWKQTLMPITTGEYWYVSAYFGVMFFAPVLNKGLQYLEKRTLTIMLVTLYIGGLVLPWLCNNNSYGFQSGYSTIWLCVLYIVGAYIGKYEIYKMFKQWQLILICTVSSFATFMAYRRQIDGLIEYTSPTIVVCSVALFMFFIKLKIKESSILEKLILLCAPSALSVFLIHVHPLVYSNIIVGSSIRFIHYGVPLFVISILIEVLLIFLLCIIIDIPRRKLFKPIKRWIARVDKGDYRCLQR